jgi:hypothetical protein
MIHRRLTHDDNKGVSEPLNETNQYNDLGLVQAMRHYLVLSDSK